MSDPTPDGAMPDDATPEDATPEGATAAEVAAVAAGAADAKGGADPVLIDVGPILGICDVFVIVTAANDRQVKAITDQVQAELIERFDRRPRSVEGADARRWVLLDYGDVVVHVLQPEERGTYRLERLYGDADRIEWHAPGPDGGRSSIGDA